MTDRLRELARAIADDLFVNGSGNRAARLVLLDAQKRDLGGWGFEPMVDRIADQLEALVRAPQEKKQMTEHLNEYLALIAEMRIVIEAIRAVGSSGHWDAPHWTLRVPAREINALFDLAYELDPKLANLESAVRAPLPKLVDRLNDFLFRYGTLFDDDDVELLHSIATILTVRAPLDEQETHS